MDAIILYYDIVELQLNNVKLYGARYNSEERVSLESTQEAESKFVPDKLVLVRTKNEMILNAGKKMDYVFPSLINVRKVGIPVEINNENVKLSFLDVPDEGLGFIGLDINFAPSVPFVILETDEGSKVISYASIHDVKPEKPTQPKGPKARKRRKKGAKKARRRRKIKSKGSRKS